MDGFRRKLGTVLLFEKSTRKSGFSGARRESKRMTYNFRMSFSLIKAQFSWRATGRHATIRLVNHHVFVVDKNIQLKFMCGEEFQLEEQQLLSTLQEL